MTLFEVIYFILIPVFVIVGLGLVVVSHYREGRCVCAQEEPGMTTTVIEIKRGGVVQTAMESGPKGEVPTTNFLDEVCHAVLEVTTIAERTGKHATLQIIAYTCDS